MELFAFNKDYVERLRGGDPSTEQHFVAYFGQLLRIKLRARTLPPDKVKDLSQETFIRVIRALRREGGVRQPERFGAFVNSICNNVLLESHRENFRNHPIEDGHFEIADNSIDLDKQIDSKRTCEQVRHILKGMPRRDQQILRDLFLEEKDKDEICLKFDVKRDYLRVLVHRAKDRFRAIYKKGQGDPPQPPAGGEGL